MEHFLQFCDFVSVFYFQIKSVDDPDEIICAFGADDGEGGKVFKFRRDDKKAFQYVKEYALSKGIPEEEIDFLKIPYPK